MDIKSYLGIDCANRTFAWCICTHDTSARRKTREICVEFCEYIDSITRPGYCNEMGKDIDTLLNALTAESLPKFMEFVNRIEVATRGFMQITSCGVHDLLGGPVSGFNDATRARKLREFLDSHNQLSDSVITCDEILVEHQPPRCGKFGAVSNQKSTAISSQLLFYYSKNNICLIGPKNKNKYSGGAGLSMEDFNPTYSGRKNHTKANLLYLAKLYRFTHVYAGVPVSLLDDLADAFMQIVSTRIAK